MNPNGKDLVVTYDPPRKHVPGRYHADAHFYPHGSFGYCYRGNIYDDSGKSIGGYGANDSVIIEENFKISWR